MSIDAFLKVMHINTNFLNMKLEVIYTIIWKNVV